MFICNKLHNSNRSSSNNDDDNNNNNNNDMLTSTAWDERRGSNLQFGERPADLMYTYIYIGTYTVYHNCIIVLD